MLWANLIPTCLAIAPTERLSRLSIRHWGAVSGLPEETFASLLAPGDGYVWLASNDGLVRFDGQRATVFCLGGSFRARGTGNRYRTSSESMYCPSHGVASGLQPGRPRFCLCAKQWQRKGPSGYRTGPFFRCLSFPTRANRQAARSASIPISAAPFSFALRDVPAAIDPSTLYLPRNLAMSSAGAINARNSYRSHWDQRSLDYCLAAPKT